VGLFRFQFSGVIIFIFIIYIYIYICIKYKSIADKDFRVKKYTGLSLSRKSCRRRRHTKTKRCHIRSYTRRFRKYTIKRGNKRVRKNIQYNVAEAPAGGGGGEFKKGVKVQIIGNINPDLILTVYDDHKGTESCTVMNKYGGIITIRANILESVPETVLAAQEERQKRNEMYLQQQRKLREEGDKAREDHLNALDQ
jgi:hypothetical protein